MGYLDQYNLSTDGGFRTKVGLAMFTTALSVAGEAKGVMGDAKYGKRQALAFTVLSAPATQLERFSYAIVADPTIVMGAPVAISSSTNAAPIVVTTSAAHGLSTGDTVRIANHATNTNANGVWTVTVLTSTTFSILEVGNGAGTGGRMTKFPADSAIQTRMDLVWDDMAGVTALD